MHVWDSVPNIFTSNALTNMTYNCCTCLRFCLKSECYPIMLNYNILVCILGKTDNYNGKLPVYAPNVCRLLAWYANLKVSYKASFALIGSWQNEPSKAPIEQPPSLYNLKIPELSRPESVILKTQNASTTGMVVLRELRCMGAASRELFEIRV